MQAYILSDHEPSSAAIRQVLLSEGHECPATHVVSWDLAPERLLHAERDLVTAILSPDPEHALTVLEDLHVCGRSRVLVVGPASDPRLVLRAMRTGAADYVDQADMESEFREALGRLRSVLPTLSDSGRTIAVLAPSGGSGSSTMAVNLATVLAKQHKSAMLVDLKLATGDLAALLDLKPTHTLAELCEHASRMDRTMLERSLVRHASGVHLLPPPANFADVRHVTSEGIRQAIALGRAFFPYVVVDVDHSFHSEQLQILRQADVVILLLRLDFTCLRHARRTLDYLADLGLKDKVRVVVNRFGQPKEVPVGNAEEALGIKVFHFVPDDPKSVNRANNNGVPVVLESPSAKVSRSIASLAGAVNGRHVAG
jgi:pilus assembly protein CpaE